MGNAAIKQMIEYIEAGDFPAEFSARDLGLDEFAENTGLPIIKMMYDAFSGSIDAAMEVHEALLLRWPWAIKSSATGGFQAWTNHALGLRGLGYTGWTPSHPARAWLIAILRALDDTDQHEGGSNG